MSGDVVVDASALVLALVGKEADATDLRRRIPAMRLHGPHLVDAEVGNVLRCHEIAGLISSEEAEAAMWAVPTLVRHRYPHDGVLARRAWTLRRNLSYYDALYVDLASFLDVPLLTADVRLSRAPGLPCQVDVV